MISGGGEASVGDGSVKSTDCKNRQTIRDCVLPDRKGQQRDSKLVGREFGEAFRSCRKELPPNSQGNHGSQSRSQTLKTTCVFMKLISGSSSLSYLASLCGKNSNQCFLLKMYYGCVH